MSGKTYLFVGGSWDGRRVPIASDIVRRGYVVLPVQGRKCVDIFDSAAAPMRLEQYRLETLQEGRNTFWFFVLDTVPSPMAALLAGYRQARGNDRDQEATEEEADGWQEG